MSATPTPHDALFKVVFSDPKNAASELRAVLPAELSARIRWSSLTVVPGSFVEEQLLPRHTDLLFSVHIDGREAFLYVLLEHQSTSDPLMAFRLLRYIVRIWDKFLENHPKATRLPAIIPVVVSHSEGGWNQPIEIAELIELDAEMLSLLSAYIPQFRFFLDDLRLQDEQALRARALTEMAAVGLFLLMRGRTSPDLLADLYRWTDVLGRIVQAPNGVAALAVLLEYAFQVGQVAPGDLRRLAQTLGPKAEEAYVTAAQQLTEKVRQESLAEGKAEGKAEVVLRLLTLRFSPLPDAVVERIRTADVSFLDACAERLLTAASLEEVLR